MKCPLFHRPKLDEPGLMSYQTGDCLKEECAWWEGHGGFCSIIKICRHLEGIANTLDNMEHKMPHVGQFGR